MRKTKSAAGLTIQQEAAICLANDDPDYGGVVDVLLARALRRSGDAEAFRKRVQRTLRRLLEGWLPVAPGFRAWTETRKIDHALLKRTLRKGRPTLSAVGDGSPFYWTPTPALPADQEAALLFSTVITDTRKLYRCKLPKCGRYFFGSGGYRRLFCSQGCGRYYSAHQTVAKRRALERSEIVARVQEAAKELSHRRAKPVDSKAWIAKRARVSKNRVTRVLGPWNPLLARARPER
jgi:hypothetical protein